MTTRIREFFSRTQTEKPKSRPSTRAKSTPTVKNIGWRRGSRNGRATGLNTSDLNLKGKKQMSEDLKAVTCPYCAKPMKLNQKKDNVQFYCTFCKARSPLAKDEETARWLASEIAVLVNKELSNG
jgi:uncharacterized protein YbaR (Trm112 family)